MEQIVCANCGRPISAYADTVVSVNTDGTLRTFCKNCASMFGHCPMCIHSAHCSFQESSDPSPQFIIKEFHQQTPLGMQIIQTQVPNADRIKRLCIDGGCKCFNDNNGNPYCSRYNGCATCTNYCEKEL